MGATTASEALAFKEILQSGLGNSRFRVSRRSTTRQRCTSLSGAWIRSLRGFERELGDVITYNAEVQELRQDDNGVSVPYRDTATGEVRVAKADYCITTIPLGILSKAYDGFVGSMQRGNSRARKVNGRQASATDESPLLGGR